MQLENSEKQGRNVSNFLSGTNVTKYLHSINVQKKWLRMNPASSLRINAQKVWLGTNGPKSTWNQSPLNLPGIHALRICQDSWPKTNTLKVFWESMLPKFYMDPKAEWKSWKWSLWEA